MVLNGIPTDQILKRLEIQVIGPLVDLVMKSDGKKGVDLILYKAKVIKRLKKELKKGNINDKQYSRLIEQIMEK